MITNEVQYRATKAHLGRFETALANLEAKVGSAMPSKLARLEIDAVRSQAEDLRAEVADYEALHSRGGLDPRDEADRASRTPGS